MKNDNIYFTIVTVCYNSENTIFRTFDSLLAQSFNNFEYVVIDGNSKDKTVDIIKEYEKKFKSKNINFKWVSEPDNGIYDAMNKGIKMANGVYIGILNSDDKYLNNTLDIVNNSIIENPGYDIYHGICKFVSNNKTTMIKGTHSDRLNISMIEHPTCFVRRELYEEFGLFDTKYKFVADYEFMLRARKMEKKFFLIENILAIFDENGAGNSYSSRKELIKLQKEYKLLSKIKLLYKYVKVTIKR